MSKILEITIILSFWVSFIMAWRVMMYEMNVDRAPEWWLNARKSAVGGVIYLLCVVGVVIPMIFFFFPPK